MARPRKFKTQKALEAAWEEYKTWCDNRKAMTHGFSAKSSRFVSANLQRSVTYTLEGFCAYAGISRQSFYETYSQRFPDTFTRMREECEVDSRMKFELGIIDSRLAPLWMSRYGYSTRAEEVPAGAQEDDPLTRSIREARKDEVQKDGVL